MFNILKKMLRNELGRERYTEYTMMIKKSIREEKRDHTVIYEEICMELEEKKPEELVCIQERVNSSLLSIFQISKGYFGVFVVYLVAFGILAEYTVEMVAVPAMLLISVMFLIKTVEFLINKFCYVDTHLVLIFKSALEKVMSEQKQKMKI